MGMDQWIAGPDGLRGSLSMVKRGLHYTVRANAIKMFG